MNTSGEKNNTEFQTSFYSWLRHWLPRQHGLFLVFVVLLAIIPINVIIFLVVLPVSKAPLLPVEEQNVLLPDSMVTNKAANWDKKTLKQVAAKEIEQLTQRNQLQLASKDSIYLILNLNDSTLSIEIKGLTVHQTKATNLQISQRILRANHDALLQWIAQPFSLQHEVATIPKVPILIIDAPKDTSEAARLPRKPLEPEKDFVQFSLLFDRHLLVEIQQEEPALPEDAEILSAYRLQYDTTFRPGIVNSIRSPYPTHRPIKIRMTMPQIDARTIYRAMPHSIHARLILIPPYSSN